MGKLAVFKELYTYALQVHTLVCYLKYSLWQQYMLMLQLFFFWNSFKNNTYAFMFAQMNICISADVETNMCIHIQLLQNNLSILIS